MKKRHLFPAPKQAPSRYARGVSNVSNRPAQCAEAAAYPAIPHCARRSAIAANIPALSERRATWTPPCMSGSRFAARTESCSCRSIPQTGLGTELSAE